MHTPRRPATNGFTLIELSIVLVVIGLIIGGVLVGQDLIRGAEIRSTVGQIGKFDTAANTFKLKYGNLPGDISPDRAGTFGFFQLTGTSCRYNDGIVNQTTNFDSSCLEFRTFWRHLSEANLIEGQYGMDATNPIDPATGSNTNTLPSATEYQKLFAPELKVKRLVLVVTVPNIRDMDGNVQYPDITQYRIMRLGTSGLPSGMITPELAYALDSKMDDGLPNTGNVRDSGNSNCKTLGTLGTAGAPDAEYYRTDNTSYLCNMRIKAGF